MPPVVVLLRRGAHHCWKCRQVLQKREAADHNAAAARRAPPGEVGCVVASEDTVAAAMVASYVTAPIQA